MEAELANSFKSKMSKVESAFLDLNNEVITACEFMQHLKNHSLHVVEKLKCIHSPSLYLQEFVKVNSILLKYISLMTEINCKFEMALISKSFKSHEDYHMETYETSAPAGNMFSSDYDYQDESFNRKGIEDDMQILPVNKDLNSFTNDHFEKTEMALNSKYLSRDLKLEKNHFESLTIEKEIENDNAFNEGNKINFNCVKDEVQNDVYFSNDSSNSETNEALPVGIKPLPYSPSNVSKTFYKILNINSSSKNCNTPIVLNEIDDIPKPDLNDRVQKFDSGSKSNIVYPLDSIISKGNHTFRIKVNNENPDAIENSINSVKSQRKIELTTVNQKNAERIDYFSTALNIHPKPGEEFEVAVEHVQSPSEFYVYFPNVNFNLIAELQNKLKSIPEPKKPSNCNNFLAKKTLLSQEIGERCLYYSICDEIWYRAEVTDWCLQFNDELVLIFVIDTGETKCVSADYLQPIPDTIKKYPVFLQRCHLSGICPVNMKENSKTFNWMKNSTEQMKCWIEISKSIKIKISPDDDDIRPSTSLAVKLWLLEEKKSDQDQWLCINELLIAASLAKAYGGVELSENKNVKNDCDSLADSIELENWNPMKEDFESHFNSYDLNIKDPPAMIYGYVGKDYQRVCRHFAINGKCYKGKSCRKEHEILNPLGYTTDKESVYKSAFNSFCTPLVGEVLNVKVTCLLKINNFYCIIENSKSGVDEETLLSLTKYMNNANNICQMQKLVVPPAIGQIVIGKHSIHNAWYRAKVLESEPENDLCTVMFVDYGYKETLPLSSIRAIEPRYLHLPFQAIKCFISGIEKNQKSSCEEGMEYLNEILNKRILTIIVVSVFPGEEICLLVHLYDEMGNDIGEELLLKNYAIAKEEIIIDSNSQVLPG